MAQRTRSNAADAKDTKTSRSAKHETGQPKSSVRRNVMIDVLEFIKITEVGKRPAAEVNKCDLWDVEPLTGAATRMGSRWELKVGDAAQRWQESKWEV